MFSKFLTTCDGGGRWNAASQVTHAEMKTLQRIRHVFHFTEEKPPSVIGESQFSKNASVQAHATLKGELGKGAGERRRMAVVFSANYQVTIRPERKGPQ